MKGFFTKENAVEYARKGNDAKEALKLAEAKAIANLAIDPQNAEEFREQRLSRVRVQLQMIDKAIEKELGKKSGMDAAKLDRLASAAIRLNEQERQLSNRSLPPTLKANAAPARKRSSTGSAPEPDFAPVVPPKEG